jgi:hypothetical protein
MHREKERPVRAWRNRALRVCFAGLILSMGTGSHAAEYRRGPAPAWVKPQPLDEQARPPLGKGSQGTHYLLVDQQTRLDGSERSTWRRVASRALNLRGVESESHLSIEFDPSYETLTLHTLVNARAIFLLIAGEAKREVIRRARAGEVLPVGRLLDQARAPVRIFWQPGV